MTEVRVIVVLLWGAVTAYAIFAGADFGAGFWDLTAGDAERGRTKRALIDHSIGPVWETNHVWLIFVLVALWTCFPTVFAAIMSTLYVPLTIVAIGIILRGSAFAFRHTATDVVRERFYGAIFAVSSVLTPFFLGTVAGSVATGRVPVGNAEGDAIGSWLNPAGVLGGTLAVVTCAFIAAVFLAHDAAYHRDHAGSGDGDGREDPESGPVADPDELGALVPAFRQRAIGAAIAAGTVALGGIFVLRADAPLLFGELTGKGLPLVLLSAAGGAVALVLLLRERYTEARVAAVVAVTSVLWAWGVGQYPFLLEGTVTIDQGAAPTGTLQAFAIVSSVGLILLVPSVVLLYSLAGRQVLGDDHDEDLDARGDDRDGAPRGRG
jgi:cytochrome d ubiquinol oxidase subunit II